MFSPVSLFGGVLLLIFFKKGVLFLFGGVFRVPNPINNCPIIF